MADLVTNKLDFGGNDAFVLQDARVDDMYTNAEIDAMIPTVNNSTITIKQGTTTKGTFTLNQSSPATITLDEGGSQIDTLGDIGDVDLVDLADGQQIHWDADTQKWVNADGVEFRTLTQAQYDALPNSKLTDGVFYYITDSTDEEFIDDDTTSSVKTWSSEKIDGELDEINKFKSGEIYTFNNLFVAGVAGGGNGKTAVFSIPLPKSPLGLTPTVTLTNLHKLGGWTTLTVVSISLYDTPYMGENYISIKANTSEVIAENNTNMNYRISGSITFN